MSLVVAKRFVAGLLKPRVNRGYARLGMKKDGHHNRQQHDKCQRANEPLSCLGAIRRGGLKRKLIVFVRRLIHDDLDLALFSENIGNR